MYSTIIFGVVDPEPDPVESETVRIQILEKSFRIRNEFEVKLLWKTDKIWTNFLTKLLKKKFIPFCKKNSAL
jgi:hypothetical protein